MVVSILDVKKMEKRRDIQGLLKASVITYNESWLNYETDHEREVKERAFRFLVDEIGSEAINSLIHLLTDPDKNICLRSIEALGKIGKQMQEDTHAEFCKKYGTNLDFLDYLKSYNADCNDDVLEVAEKIWDKIAYGPVDDKTLNRVIECLNKLASLIKDSRFNEDDMSNDMALCNINKIKIGIKQSTKPFTKTHTALSKLTHNKDDEISAAAKDAIRYFYFLPIFGLNSRNEYEDNDSNSILNVICQLNQS